MKSLVLTSVILTLLCGISVGQQPKGIFSRRAKHALSVYESEIREINQTAARNADIQHRDLIRALQQAHKEAVAKGDAEDAASIAALEVAADPAVPVMAPARSYWEHQKGFFQQLTPSEWVERTPTKEVVLYTEVARTPEYVELSQDGGKGKSTVVRLFPDHQEFKKSDQKKFTPSVKGQWALPQTLRSAGH